MAAEFLDKGVEIDKNKYAILITCKMSMCAKYRRFVTSTRNCNNKNN